MNNKYQNREVWERMGRDLGTLRLLAMKITCDGEYQDLMTKPTWLLKLTRAIKYIETANENAAIRMYEKSDIKGDFFYGLDVDGKLSDIVSEVRRKTASIDCDDPTPKTDYTFGEIISFKPFTKEIERIILQELEGYIENQNEIKEYENAKEWTEIVEGIKKNGVSAYEDDVCGYIADMFEAVCGQPNRYLCKSAVEFFDAVCEYYDPSKSE